MGYQPAMPTTKTRAHTVRMRQGPWEFALGDGLITEKTERKCVPIKEEDKSLLVQSGMIHGYRDS